MLKALYNTDDFVKKAGLFKFVGLAFVYLFLASAFNFLRNGFLDSVYLFFSSLFIGVLFFLFSGLVMHTTALILGKKGFIRVKKVLVVLLTVLLFYYFLLLLNDFFVYYFILSETYLAFSYLFLVVVGSLHSLVMGVKAVKKLYGFNIWKSLVLVLSPLVVLVSAFVLLFLLFSLVSVLFLGTF